MAKKHSGRHGKHEDAEGKTHHPKQAVSKQEEKEPKGFKAPSSSPSVNPTSSGQANLTLPSITGDTVSGSTLTCNAGTWDGPFSYFLYQWWRYNNILLYSEQIPDTESNFVPADSDIGYHIWCSVTSLDVGGNPSDPAYAPAVGPVVAAGQTPDGPDTPPYVEEDALCAKCGRPWNQHYPGTFDKCPITPESNSQQLYDNLSSFTPIGVVNPQ
jgi:hypothetical protein